MDDGHGGEFLSLIGNATSGDSLATAYTVAHGVEAGGVHRFRWRARNANGWSAFSPVAYIRAARVPGRPDAPILDSVDATSITVTLRRALDDGGSNVLGHELWRNQGTGTADFIRVTTYGGQLSSHTLTTTADALLAGQIYALKSRASNEFGYGEFSEELSVGLSSYPAAPASLAKVDEESGATYITLQWPRSAGTTDLPVLGYALYMANNSDGTDEFRVLYNGLNYPNVLRFTVAANVRQGAAYTFRVHAMNYNGLGPASTPVEYTICTTPDAPDFP